MTRLSWFPILGLALGCSAPEPPTDIILVTIDTLRADRVGVYGGRALTPNIDGLAAAGKRFDACFTVVPTTLASHASMFTGQYPRTLAVPRNGFEIPTGHPTLAHRLGSKGWNTGGFVSSFALDARFGLDQGFDVYDSGRTLSEELDQDWRKGEDTVDLALDWIAGAGAGPIFLWVHLFDPHFPYAPDPEYFPSAESTSKLDGSMETITGIWSGRIQPTPEDIAHLTSLYEAEIGYADAQVGRLLDGYANLRNPESAWWIVTSDHGESLGEHAYFFDHGRNLYETDLRVPLVVRPPIVETGESSTSVVTKPVRTLDLYASILEMADLAPEGDTPSRSWVHLSDASGEERLIFAEATKPHGIEGRRKWPNHRKSRSIRRGDDKLIETPYLGRRECYDLANDPGELSPSQGGTIADRLLGELRDWELSTAPRPGAWITPGQDSSRRLEALGYID